MKHIIISFLLVFGVFLGLFVNKADACSLIEGFKYPTVQETITKGGNIFIGKTLSAGRVVAGEVIESKTDTVPQYVVLVGTLTSCDDVRPEFSANEYFLVVTPSEKSSMIRMDGIDDQFVYFYKTEAEARAGMAIFVNTGGNGFVAPEPLPSTPEDMGAYTPVSYTLRKGIKNNEDVRVFQDALNRTIGSALELDGSYGTKTFEAVYRFQLTYNLKADGVAGQMTQGKLSEITRTVTTKLQICPQEWVDNQMPSTSPNDGVPREYFILDGARHEMAEFDVTWVKANCNLEAQVVY